MRMAVICVAVLVTVSALTGCGRDNSAEMSFRDFVDLVKTGKVSQAEFVREAPRVSYIIGEAKPENSASSPRKFKVYVAGVDDYLMNILRDNRVQFSMATRNPVVWQCLSGALPFLIMLLWIVVIIFILILAVRLVRAVERIARNTEK